MFYSLGKFHCNTEQAFGHRVEKMMVQKFENANETHNKKWPDDGGQNRTLLIEVTGHAHASTLELGQGSEAWIAASTDASALRFTSVAELIARHFTGRSYNVVLIFSVCMTLGTCTGAIRGLLRITARYSGLSLVLHTSRVMPLDAQVLTMRICTALTSGLCVGEAVRRGAATAALPHGVLLLSNGTRVDLPATRSRLLMRSAATSSLPVCGSPGDAADELGSKLEKFLKNYQKNRRNMFTELILKKMETIPRLQ
jgi:hypothetical protein